MTSLAARARLAVAAGDVVTIQGLGPRHRRALALAEMVGAPAADALEGAADADRQADEVTRAVAVATAQARFVGRGLASLPVVLVPALDLLLGLPLLGFYRTSPGRTVGVLGVSLLLAGVAASAGFVHRVAARPARSGVAPDDEVADLLALAVRAGLPSASAVRAVATVLPGHATALRLAALAIEHGRDISAGTAVTQAATLLQTAELVGAPAADELLRLASEQRADEHARIRARAERLPAQLTIPSVLLLLPATVLLVGAPMVWVGIAPT